MTDTLPAAAGAAVVLFAGTNIDDMVVLAVLNASSRTGGLPKRWQIWAGQYAGIAILVAVSLGAGRGLALLPEHWIWVLGLLPLGLGLWKVATAIRARHSGEQASITVARGLTGVTGVTIANGGDNLAAYTPVFATISASAAAVTVAVFGAGVAVWCLAGAWVVSHHRLTEALHRWGHWVIPAVYILIGLYIFQKAGLL